jgi:AbrB family looped-hinge helix DNA binding protein
MVMPMEVEVKIDKQGRLVIPKELREKYQMNPDSEILLVDQEEGILLKPMPAKRSLKEIFSQAPRSNLEDAYVLDYANYHKDTEV